MSLTIIIQDITIEKLKGGNLKKELPEFYSLYECIEHFPHWHDHETVFDHTLSVLNSLQKILNRDDVRLQDYLKYKPYEHYSRRDLLYLATILHDIAKPETLVINSKGYTSCPDHDKQGSSKARRILPQFDVNYPESEQVVEMIWLHELFCFTKHPQTPDEDYKRLGHLYPHIYCDMFLFELADTQGLHVTRDGKKLQQTMIHFYEKKIDSFLKHYKL